MIFAIKLFVYFLNEKPLTWNGIFPDLTRNGNSLFMSYYSCPL